MTLQAQLLVIAKEPLAGRSKTRLSPALTPDDAALVARASLLDTLTAVAATPVLARTVVLDGSPTGWLPDGFAVVPQVEGDLGARLDDAFRTCLKTDPAPALLVGMDTPQVTPQLLTAALDALLQDDTDAVLGLAEDGGWWALGLRQWTPGLFEQVPMSTDRTGALQRQRLDVLGLRTSELPVLRDIDLVDDLAAVAAAMPLDSHLARLLPRLAVAA